MNPSVTQPNPDPEQTALEQIRFLSERERQLVRLSLEIGSLNCWQVQERVGSCQQHGLSASELLEVALIAVQEIDFPIALTWISNGLAKQA